MSYRSEVLADNPVLFLTLNETAGNFADSSVSGLTGVPNGSLTRGTATGHAGLGAGVTFAGLSTTFVSVADTPILDLTGDFTYECWLIFQTFGTAQALMSKGQDASGTTAGYEMYLTTGPALVVDRCNITAGYRPGTGPTTGAWRYVAVTRTGDSWAMYVDATQVNTATVSLTPDATARDFCIGTTYTVAGPGVFPCNATTSMSNVAVYGTGLTQARCLAHYNARDTGSGGGGSAVKSPPGVFVAALAHERNIERKLDQQGQQVPPSRHRARLDYRRKRGR
jgi:hypothetical protein